MTTRNERGTSPAGIASGALRNGRKGQRLADLRSRTAELERQLSDARARLERELGRFGGHQVPPPGQIHHVPLWGPATVPAGDWAQPDGQDAAGGDLDGPAGDLAPPAGDWAAPAGDWPGPAEDRTEELVSHGRPTAYRPGLSRIAKTAIGAAVTGALITVAVILLSGGGGSWPASVAVMERQAGQACRNPDVRSEPAQVNFACAPDTRQVLWVFALLTSGGNPRFRDAGTGRLGLEPITPAQGGQLAWSLNLHHPYRPSDPVDSLQVAARAINNIIGGATLTGPDGKLVIQSGLEGNPANCLRYTGSAAVRVRGGFPRLCARPVTTAGRAALVADVFRKWVVGSPPAAAQDAAVLFANAHDPGNPQVQAILRHLPRPRVSP